VLSLRVGTTDVVRKEGFLCVISLLSTFRNDDVTEVPRLRSAKTALISPPFAFSSLGFIRLAALGGGGGGGGPGGPPAGAAGAGGAAVAVESSCLKASPASIPSFWFHVSPSL
jgi:hypothetical protein